MDPMIVQFDDAVPQDYCAQVIQRFQQSPDKVPGRTGAGVDTSKKESSDLYISSQESWRDVCRDLNGVVYQALTDYCRRYPHMLTGAVSPGIRDESGRGMRTLTAADIESLDEQLLKQLVASFFCFDGINLQHYRKSSGGYHHWHSEHFPHPTDPQQKSLHRVLFWLLYLNDVEEGGETEFFYQKTGVKPRAGRLLLSPCGFTHTHRGNVPVSEDKYILTSWVMYRPAQQLYGKAPG
ncbi:2OG-Fe(II) oxygenase [Microbulbifer pacificus]|uniref:2OG-Fe(II) oxygenase n=1 Tax=Microbulbifer pacificus TaxID=407164 RepID=A0AAU0N4D7_9GAMM|nr:2OG-Fe(II) oxygenase [Microbulbifer pacificus]WOX07110.1 2OG-Fe(II) oxygenase [Microbulbifer pacificus]